MDRHFRQHLDTIPEHVVRGAYHYGYPQADRDPVQDATGEANAFVSRIGAHKNELAMPPVLDWEHGAWDNTSNGIGNMSTQQREDWITAFLHRMRELGYHQVVIYVGVSVWHRSITDGGRAAFDGQPLWIAQYPLGDKTLNFEYSASLNDLVLPAFGSVVLWQYSGKGKLVGFRKDETIDLNRMVDVEGFGWQQLVHDLDRGQR